MDTGALRTFVVAARCGSFRRAADLRFVSQSTVTQQVKRLEFELGVQLFRRSGRSVRLSPAGELFLPRAERVLRELADAAADLINAGPDPLRIAAAPHVARVFLPHLLGSGAAPSGFALSVLPSTEVPEAVRSGHADIGLSRFRPLPPDVTGHHLYDDDLVLVACHDGLDLEREPPDAVHLLERLPLFTYGPGATWIAVEETLRRLPIAGLRQMHVAQVDIARQFVLAGFGVAVLPLAAARADLAFGRLIDVPLPGITLPKDSVYAVLPAVPPAAVAAFLRAAEEFFRLRGSA